MGSTGVVLGVAPYRLKESPFVVLNSPSLAAPERTLHLGLEPAALAWPTALDESPCQGLDWRTYRAVANAEEWAAFWDHPRPFKYEIGIGVLEYVVPMRRSEFAFALIGAQDGEVHLQCGCYEN